MECCICLAAEVEPPVGKLDPCGHEFCFACIRKWTEEETHHCPLCKHPATRLLRVEGVFALAERARSASPLRQEEVREMEALDDCVVCRSGEREDVLLLCDSCGRGCHTFCVGMADVPPGDWYCADCRGAHEGACTLCGAAAHGGALRVVDGKCATCRPLCEVCDAPAGTVCGECDAPLCAACTCCRPVLRRHGGVHKRRIVDDD